MLTVQNSLEIPDPSHWPTSMVRFGKSPNGKNLFRVVFAPSVKKRVFGQFPDGYVGARLRTTYPQLGDVWILEKWLSGWEDTLMTPGQYEREGLRDPQSGMLINGPYPFEGTYNQCWTFDADTLQGGMEGAIEKIIGLIRKGEGKSLGQIKAENAEIDAKEEKRAAEERFMRVREKEPLYGIRPANFAGSPKSVNHKTQRTPISANQLQGMPRKRGSVVAMKGPQVNASV